jgi:hypothetical protein
MPATVLAAFAVAGLVLVVGGSIEWAGIACALFTLTPEFSVILRNGRMDSLALGFEFAGIGFLLGAMCWPALAIPWSLTAGVFWTLALLVTARETRKTFLLSITCLLAASSSGCTCGPITSRRRSSAGPSGSLTA